MSSQQRQPKRILILGKSGSGKSTLAKKLSRLLTVKEVELDSIFWKPNWTKVFSDDMRIELEKQLRPDGEWIVDGNYRAFADITWAHAELIIWLDYSILFVLWRLFLRSVQRIWTQEQVCGENYESGWAIFWPTMEYNVLIACLYQSRKLKNEYPKMIKEYGEGKMLIFKKEHECEEWLERLRHDLGADQKAP
jgi:adenylate kinase family enzyme